jgi:hypothetical protein
MEDNDQQDKEINPSGNLIFEDFLNEEDYYENVSLNCIKIINLFLV